MIFTIYFKSVIEFSPHYYPNSTKNMVDKLKSLAWLRKSPTSYDYLILSGNEVN